MKRYKLDIKSNNSQNQKPDLIVLFCLKEFKNEIKEIDKKFHSFIHWYDEKFRKLYESKKDLSEFLKLRNSKENNSILYSGFESKINKYNKKIDKYKKEYQDIFLTKIRIKGEGGTRLLSMVGYNLKTDGSIPFKRIIFHIYPIIFDNFHNK